MSRAFNELSEVTVTASPFDINGNPYTPINARYKVNDCFSGEMVPWTNLTPATEMQIVIPGTVNTILQDRIRRPPESKVVTVNTDAGLSTQHYEEYEYKLKNLSFVE